MNPLFDVVASPAVERIYDALGARDQAEFARLVTLLRVDPWPDEMAGKFDLTSDIADLFCFERNGWAIWYKVIGQTV